MKKEFLPLGSVVLLKDGTKKLMITGYVSKSSDDDLIYDYSGCVFPEGIMENVYCLFNNNDIKKIYFEGLKNEEFDNYCDKMNSILSAKIGNPLANSDYVNNDTPRKGRAIRAPKHPKSKADMHRLYDVHKISGGQDKVYNPDDYAE